MPGSLKTKIQKALTPIIALTPWVISMYMFYWLEYSGTWTSDTPHRGKISVVILATGMLLSFLLQSHFIKRRPN